MKKPLLLLTIFITITCLFPQLTFAKTGWVSDMLLLTFRQGPGASYAVIKTLKSNTPVLILEEKNDFYKVELQSKEIGWVNKKFITFELPKPFIIDQLKQKNKDLQASLTTALDEKERKQTPLIEPSKNSQKIIKENKRLQEKNSMLSREIEILKEENKGFLKIDMIKWFLAGVGVLLLGWIIGHNISSKKRRSGSLLG
ncbi:TIGR04211 family SH3 domain-containing protein [Desulfobacula sp.]|uniref:TIGR04211 family SH3 domain-containing protein n=1 Tax=Desulfobacula sp. TaxID=2593537 RepID=UPI0025C009B2|nr:TIGR04211 family SH3 domain-containing protein [Desulfobacula sp.]MBC2705067.1 TIGR04211 family SH3 domain-containing protein [Desulfobacula sp.]